MKRFLLFALCMCLCVAASAQFVRRNGTHLVQQGQKLSKAEAEMLLSSIDGKDYNAEWNKAKVLRGTGLGLTIGGGVVTAAGITTVLIGATASFFGVFVGASAGAIVGGSTGAQQGADAGAKAGKDLITGGLIAGGVGLAALAAGIPLLSVGTHRMNDIVRTYNGTVQPATVAFGPTQYGFGLSLNF